MKFIRIYGFLLISSSAWSLEDLSNDVTTISYGDASETTPVPEEPEVILADDTGEISTDIKAKPGSHCMTSRGQMGSCMMAEECYPVLFPKGYDLPSHGPPYNEELARMLIEGAGFCSGENQHARKVDDDPKFYRVMNSEVLVCCPEKNTPPPESFELSESPSANASEAIKGRQCGFIKIDQEELETVEMDSGNSTEPTTNSTEPSDDRIVKGRKTRIGEFPWMVAMMNRGRQFCAGSLISARTVLTAAHCVEQMTGRDVRNMRLKIGDWNIYSSKDVKHVERKVVSVKYHRGFNQRHLQHDLALLIMESPVQFSRTIQPVCLHNGNPRPNNGKTIADVAGWGAIRESGPQSSILRTVRVRVITPRECKSRYGKAGNKIAPAMICAGSDKGEDSCQGDSGGPLTIDSRQQAKQIGIVSWGIGCGRYPGVYTAVYRYLQWISKHQDKTN